MYLLLFHKGSHLSVTDMPGNLCVSTLDVGVQKLLPFLAFSLLRNILHKVVAFFCHTHLQMYFLVCSQLPSESLESIKWLRLSENSQWFGPYFQFNDHLMFNMPLDLLFQISCLWLNLFTFRYSKNM